MRIQFPLRALLQITVVCGLLSLVAKWLIGLGAPVAFDYVSAFGVGLLVGVGLCLIHQQIGSGNRRLNTALVALVVVGAWWFRHHFGTFMLGVTLGTVSVLHRAALLSYLFGLLGLSVTSDKRP